MGGMVPTVLVDGPAAVARFITNESNDEIQADVSGAVRSLLGPLGGTGP